MQQPPPCRSACFLQKEDAGGSLSLNSLIQEQMPFEVALLCLLLVRDPQDEAFDPACYQLSLPKIPIRRDVCVDVVHGNSASS